jgi:hypothetical protein
VGLRRTETDAYAHAGDTFLTPGLLRARTSATSRPRLIPRGSDVGVDPRRDSG